MEEYGLNQKEAYEILYEKYYICMRLTQSFVEIGTREKIHNSFKEEKDETKNQTNDLLIKQLKKNRNQKHRREMVTVK